MATNADVAEKLGVSHSTVSRMRTGKRVGSPQLLYRIHEVYGIPLERVMGAATEALNGKTGRWVKLMDGILKREADQ